jgi:hypothetical protein
MCCKCGGSTQHANAVRPSRQTSTHSTSGSAHYRLDGRPRRNRIGSIGRPTCGKTPCGGRSRRESCHDQCLISSSRRKTSQQMTCPALHPNGSQHLQGAPGFLHSHATTTPDQARQGVNQSAARKVLARRHPCQASGSRHWSCLSPRVPDHPGGMPADAMSRSSNSRDFPGPPTHIRSRSRRAIRSLDTSRLVRLQ